MQKEIVEKSLNILKTIIFAIIVLVSIILNSFFILINNSETFFKFFTENQIYNEFSESPETLNNYFDQVLTSIRINKNIMSPEFFSEKDLIHMNDVISLVFGIKIFTVLSTIGFLLFLTFSSLKTKLVVVITSLIILILSGIFLLANFSQAFLLFHKISFTNENWILNPAESMLIRFLPEKLFVNSSIQIFTTTILIHIILLFVVIILSWIKNQKRKQ